MYAIVDIGGKQHRVSIGDKLNIEKLDTDEGDSIHLDGVLMVVDRENIHFGYSVSRFSVTAKILSHGKTDKIRIFKMKRRKNYRRTYGHRQSFTKIEILNICEKKKI